MRIARLLFLSFILFGCDKSTPREVIKNFVDAELKHNYSFNEGSYWVYEGPDSRLDSVILMNATSGFTNPTPNYSIMEYFTYRYHSFKTGKGFNHYYTTNFIRYNGGGDYGQNGQPIFILEKNEGNEFNGLLVGESLDSMLIFGEVFYNVQKMTVIASNQYEPVFKHDRDFYFSPGVGIVKYVIKDTVFGVEEWSLKKYHLN